jgi:predicted nucleotide-binding protein
MRTKEEAILILDYLIKYSSKLKTSKKFELREHINSEYSKWMFNVSKEIENIFPDYMSRFTSLEKNEMKRISEFQKMKINSQYYGSKIYFGKPGRDWLEKGINTNDIEIYLCKIDNTREFLKKCIKEIKDKNMFEPINEYHKLEKAISHSYFIAHGHDELMLFKIKDAIADVNAKLDCVILHMKANAGLTILEKFEKHSEVDFAVCLWSADDEGKASKENENKPRARQNVILETGFFWGKLGRDRVIVIHDEGVDIPSDLHGLLYIPYKDNWKDNLRKEIEKIYASLN